MYSFEISENYCYGCVMQDYGNCGLYQLRIELSNKTVGRWVVIFGHMLSAGRTLSVVKYSCVEASRSYMARQTA